MDNPIKLYDLFPGLPDKWPYEFIPSLEQGSNPAIQWLNAINDAVSIFDLRTNVTPERVSISCRYETNPFSDTSIEFKIRPIAQFAFRVLKLDFHKRGNIFIDLGPEGPDIIIEGLPVEIRIPPDLIFGDPNSHTPDNQDEDPDPFIGLDPGEITEAKNEFATDPHAQFVILRNDPSNDGGFTSVFTHIRLHITPAMDVELQTAAPISFGRCGFMNLPVVAIHDFQIIPSPKLLYDEKRKLVDTGNWVRHNLYNPDGSAAIAMRSIEFDFERGYLKKAIPEGQKRDVKAEWVFEDLIFNIGNDFALPVPTHLTVGLRRNIDNFDDPTDIFAFENAAASFFFKMITIRVYRLYLQTISGGVNHDVDLGISTGDKTPEGEKDATKEITVEWTDDNTIRVGFTWLPGADYPSWLKWRFSDKLIVNLINLKTGVSINKIRDDASFWNFFEITGSFWIHDIKAKWDPSTPADTTPAATATDAPLKVDSPPDKPLSLIITDVGWRQGHVSFEKFSLPEGYSPRLGPLTIDLFEMGLLSEDDATYFSVSGGIRMGEMGKVWEGGIWFKRMRFRIGGNPAADRFKMDGITGMLAIGDFFKIEIGGYYTDETNIPENYHKEEFGFTGKLELKLTATWTFALDLITGKLTTLDTQDTFHYFMAQFYIGYLPVASYELNNIRALLAINMKPNLSAEDQAQDQLKYYHWQKSIDPLTVPGSRRLEGWIPRKEAFVVGAGLGISFNGFGDLCKIVAFFVYAKSPLDGERSLTISIEFYLGKPSAGNDQQRTPVAWGVVEYDYTTGDFAAQLGFDLTLKKFVPSAPDVLANILKIKGTIFFGNNPGTVAMGRIADQNSWAMVEWDWDLFDVIRTYARAAFCFEMVEGSVKGVGVAIRVEGGIDAGFFGIYYYAGVTFTYQNFTTGSPDWVGLLSADIGGYVKLFWVIRFGLDVHGEIRVINFKPSTWDALVKIHISTSWWLPDISWSYETQSGTTEPGARTMIGAPLGDSGSFHPATGKTTKPHHQSLSDGLISLNDMNGLAVSESTRLERFNNSIHDPENPLEPVATDATIIAKFSSPVDQSLGIGNVSGDWGTQLTGDDQNHMKIKYELTGIAIRRRPRYGTNRVWSNVDESSPLVVIDPNTGEPVQGSISFEQTNLTYLWDADKQEKGKNMPMNLLINSDTPFSYTTENMAGDENLLNENPEWPCCRREPVNPHWYNYRLEPIGEINRNLRRWFHMHNGFELITKDGFIVPKKITADADPVNVAAFYVVQTAQVMHMVFDDNSVAASVYLYAEFKKVASVTLIAENDKGEVVLTKTHDFNIKDGWVLVPVSGNTFRSVRLIATVSKENPWTLFVDMATWLSADDYVRSVVNGNSCAGLNPNRGTDFSGNGGLFFLPNHEYEIALTTKISVKHNSTNWESQTCTEYIYFITKGLPGLNYTEEPGAEIKPYVQAAYPTMRPFIYAEEPVTLVLNEKFKLSLPVAVRRPGDAEEHMQMMNLKLTVNRELDDKLISSAEEIPVDWITATAAAAAVRPRGIFGSKTVIAKSKDTRTKRLVGLLEASTSGGCGNTDISLVNNTILVVYPTDRLILGKKYWNRNIACTASLKLDNPIFISHPSFVATDINAFTLVPNTLSWSVVDGKLSLVAGTGLQVAQFGDAAWNYFQLRTEIVIASGKAGIQIGNTPITILVEKITGGYNVTADNISKLTIDDSETVQLMIAAYDDRIAVAVNNKTFDVPRGESREGRCAFVVDGRAGFANIFVEPLQMYGFNFRVSRFDHFNDHINDFDPMPGRLNLLSDADFENALTTLQPGNDDTQREADFVKLASAGGIFIQQEVNRSKIHLLMTSGGNCAGLLLESAESLDMSTGELQLTFAKKVITDQQAPADTIEGLDNLLTMAKASIKHPTFHGDLLNSIILPATLADAGMYPLDVVSDFRDSWTYPRMIRSIQVTPGTTKNKRTIRPQYRTPLITLAGKDILYIEYNYGQKQMVVFAGTVANANIIPVTFTKSVTIALGGENFRGTKLIRMILVPSENIVCYCDINRQVTEWRPADLTFIQNHDATRLFILPSDPGSFFEPGDWKLVFNLNRVRYETMDNTDELAKYSGSAFIEFEIT